MHDAPEPGAYPWTVKPLAVAGAMATDLSVSVCPDASENGIAILKRRALRVGRQNRLPCS